MLLVDQLKQAFSAARAYITKLFSKKKKSVTPFPTAQAPTEATVVASGTKATDAKTSKGVATKKKKKSRKATPVNLDDVRSTLAIFDNTDGEHWKSRAGWRSILPVNQWFGILIFESRVVELCLGLNALKVESCIRPFVAMVAISWHQLLTGLMTTFVELLGTSAQRDRKACSTQEAYSE